MRRPWIALALSLLPLGCGDADTTGSTNTPPANALPCVGACCTAERSLATDLDAHPGALLPTATDAQRLAFARVNRWRRGMGLSPLNQNAQLQAAAQAHSDFMASNPQASCWPGGHDENPACPGFTGAGPAARVTAAGYRPSASSEVIDFDDDPEQSIDTWMWSVYHRVPFTTGTYLEAGWATATGRGATRNTMELGRALTAQAIPPARPAVFPLPGQDGVPIAFFGQRESPTPPPPNTHAWSEAASGPVVTVTFPTTAFTVTAHRLYDGDCAEVAHSYFDAQSDRQLNARSAAVYLYADRQLARATVYTVSMEGTSGGAPWQRTWSFRTE